LNIGINIINKQIHRNDKILINPVYLFIVTENHFAYNNRKDSFRVLGYKIQNMSLNEDGVQALFVNDGKSTAGFVQRQEEEAGEAI
jgi:hypothetical protein